VVRALDAAAIQFSGQYLCVPVFCLNRGRGHFWIMGCGLSSCHHCDGTLIILLLMGRRAHIAFPRCADTGTSKRAQL
jgi:hypothetical protein